uniref:Protein quiver n=1 Tax=Rhodnius prolixus TaxID=13249 RepID=T1I2D3_RHOPR
MYAFMLFVIVAFTIDTGYCLKCYHCESTENKKCLDPFTKKNFVQTECTSDIVMHISKILSNIDFFKKRGLTGEFQCVKLNVTSVFQNPLIRNCVVKPAANNYCEELIKNSKSWLSLDTVHYCGTCESDGCNGVGKVKGIWLAIIGACLVCVFPKLLPNLW